MLLAIIAIWFGYKKARDSGRNAILWAAISGGAYIGVQLLVGIGMGAVMGFGIAAFGWPESVLDSYQIVATIGGIVAAVATILLIFRYLDRVPDEPVFSEPPPPPTFGGTDQS